MVMKPGISIKNCFPTGLVRMEFDKERLDRYGRLLAYVYLTDMIRS